MSNCCIWIGNPTGMCLKSQFDSHNNLILVGRSAAAIPNILNHVPENASSRKFFLAGWPLKQSLQAMFCFSRYTLRMDQMKNSPASKKVAVKIFDRGEWRSFRSLCCHGFMVNISAGTQWEFKSEHVEEIAFEQHWIAFRHH